MTGVCCARTALCSTRVPCLYKNKHTRGHESNAFYTIGILIRYNNIIYVRTIAWSGSVRMCCPWWSRAVPGSDIISVFITAYYHVSYYRDAIITVCSSFGVRHRSSSIMIVMIASDSVNIYIYIYRSKMPTENFRSPIRSEHRDRGWPGDRCSVTIRIRSLLTILAQINVCGQSRCTI